jgi:hypothetical protein
LSVTSPIPDENGIVHTALGQLCFYCESALSDPAVHWLGVSDSIFLHPTCVGPFSFRLRRNVDEIDRPEYYRAMREGLRLLAERRRSP